MGRKVTILGAGGTGLTLAAVWTLAGHDVLLYDEPDQEGIAELRRTGHIEVDFPDGKKIVPAPRTALGGEELADRGRHAEVVVFACTVWRQESMIRAILPLLKDGQTLLFAPGNLGSILFRNLFESYVRTTGIRPHILVGEMEGNWFPCRRTGPASVIQATTATARRVAALPSSDTPELMKSLEGLVETIPCSCVLEATLNSPNVVIHLAASLLNLGGAEKKGREFCLFRDGLTPAVHDVVERMNIEKESVYAAYGWMPRSPLPLLRDILRGDLSDELKRFVSLQGPDGPQHRYLREDAMCGVSLLHELAALASVPTPVTDALLTLAGVLHDRDYLSVECGPLRRLGFAGNTPEDLNVFLSGKGENHASGH